MISLRKSLEALVDSTAAEALTEGGTPEGSEALARVTLLLGMLDRLREGGDPWWQSGMLPAEVPLIAQDAERNAGGRPN